jgi:hypothetical protein
MRYLISIFTFLGVLTGAISFAADAPEESTKEEPAAESVPLDQIWAHGMPGTRDIQELEEKPEDENSLMATIGRALQARHDRKVGKSFAVEGTGLGALKAAYAVITGQRPVAKSLASGEVSIAFFTHYSPYYVHLAKVTRNGESVRIEYELIPHLTKEITLHFALIPLGKLPSGNYKVDVVAKPTAEKLIAGGFKEVSEEKKARIVSSSFKFHVD